MAGRIFLCVHASPEKGESEDIQSYMVMVILKHDMSEHRRFLMPSSSWGYYNRSMRVGDDGIIYQMRFDVEGVTVVKYKP